MRLQTALHALPLLAMTFGGIAHAQTLSVVVAVDATLGADERAVAESSIATLAGALPQDDEFGLIVFGDVVLRTVALAPLGADQLDAVDAALAATTEALASSLAIGLERGLDELREAETGHLVLFARARVDGVDAEDTARFGEWYRELLLPDAAERGIAVTLVSPDTGADAAVRADLIAHPANASYSLATGPDGDIGRALLGRVTNPPTDGITTAGVAATETSPATAVDETPVAEADADEAAVVARTTVAEAPVVESDADRAATLAATTVAEAPVVESDADRAATLAATTVAEAPFVDVNADAGADGATASDARPDTASRTGPRLSPYAIAAFAIAAALLAFLAFTARRGKTTRAAKASADTADTAHSAHTGASSAYLPLHATAARSGRSAPGTAAARARSHENPTRDVVHDAPTAKGAAGAGVLADAEAATANRRGADDPAGTGWETVDADTVRTGAAADVETAKRDSADTGTDTVLRPTVDSDAPTARTDGKLPADETDDLELLAALTAKRREQDRLD